MYSTDTAIAGFQFVVSGVDVTGAGGGAAGAAGFTVSTGNNTVLGFSLTGATIAAGEGVLVVLDVTGDGDACLSDLVISDSSGNALDATVENCTTISIGGGDVYGCTDMDACNYNADATADDGSCDYGTMCWDGSYECNASDCPDQPGESSISFGVVSEGSLEVLLSNDVPVAGFQFDINGLTITGASGGSAEAAGFMISTSASTVLGFSLEGATIPSGSGVLVNVTFTGGGDACLDNVVLSDSGGDSMDVAVGGCIFVGEEPEPASAPIPAGAEGGSGSSPTNMHPPTATSMESPPESDRTTLSKQASPPPVKVTFTRTPLPEGIVAPSRLNPNTVEALVDIIKPAASADPPDAPVIVKPLISN
jgi:hypothetical protein